MINDFKRMVYVVKDHHTYKDLIEITATKNVMVAEHLKKHTYTRLGGAADFYVTPDTYHEVQQIIKLANQTNIPFTMLGNGSNLIVKDGGIRGIVLNLQNFASITSDGTTVVAGSGARIIDVSRYALANQLSGLEFACGIPGSVGGALFMNAGAYGGDIKDVLESTIVITRDGEVLTFTADELNLSHRSSNIPDNGYIVLDATFSLTEGDYAA